jgi:uncharacterized protein
VVNSRSPHFPVRHQSCITFINFDEDQEMASSNQGGKQSGSGTRGGSPEQHSEAGRQSHKNDDSSSGGKQGGSSSGGKQGGSSEQHSEAGRQSHKNDK